MKYPWNILIALDKLLNTLLGGDPDETLSSRMGKAVRENRCWPCKLSCWLLHLIDKDHCQKTIEPDEGQRAVID